MRLQVLVDDALQGAYRQLDLGVGNRHIAVVAFPYHLDDVALALALIGVGISRFESRHEIVMIHVKQDAVNGLKAQGIVVVVHHLHQRVPGGQAGPLALRSHLFQVLIALLGGGQRVVAVAHGEQQGRHAAHAIFFLHLGIGA